MISRERCGCLPYRARTYGSSLPSPTLFLPRSLVLAAVLVVVTGAMVALAPSHRDAEGAIATGITTWILKRPRERAAIRLIYSHKQYPHYVQICPWLGLIGFGSEDVHWGS